MLNIEKKSIENFNNNDIVEHATNSDTMSKEQIKELIHSEYNYDLEAIRNLGAISKSLLTGKNYHNTNISLNSNYYDIIESKVCDASNDNIITPTTPPTTEEEAQSACDADPTCKGFTKNSATSFTLYNKIDGPSSVGATAENNCSLKRNVQGSLENNRLIIPANVQIQGWAVGVPKGTVIMWSMETPPPPNTTPYNYLSTTEGYTLADTDCWYPCIGGNVLGLHIPNLLGRMVVGQGIIDNNPSYAAPDHIYNYANLRESTSGIVPVAKHKHNVAIHETDTNHQHDTKIRHDTTGANQGDGHTSGKWENTWGRDEGKITFTSEYQKDRKNHKHSHGVTISDPVSTVDNRAIASYYTRHTIPHSTVLQFWIRVR